MTYLSCSWEMWAGYARVLMNLIGNAVKFTEKGEVVVHASCAPNEKGDPQLRITVRDTGIGIEPEAQTRLFTAFTQADVSISRHFGGTGLGLAISRQLIELMGGRIGVDSVPGQGSTFWFTIALPVLPASNGDARELALQGIRVLLVDDNATNRKILHYLAIAWGMTPTEAASGSVATALLAEEPLAFEAVILDLEMPGMNGLELAANIRANARIAHLPLILLSSLGSTEHSDAVKGLTVDAYLTKPVRRTKLHRVLTSVLESSIRVSSPGVETAGAKPSERSPVPHAGRILVVEDNIVNQKLTRRLVEKMGFYVDVAADGNEAVVAALRTSYDLILMDCQMPVLDGYEATSSASSRVTHAPHSNHRADCKCDEQRL